MSQKNNDLLDPLDYQILNVIPQGEAVTFRFIFDNVRTLKTQNGVRYRIDRLIKFGYLRSGYILDRVVYMHGRDAPGQNQPHRRVTVGD